MAAFSKSTSISTCSAIPRSQPSEPHSGCRAEKVNSLQTEVDGEVGLSGRSNGTPRRLPYEMNQDGRERCRSFQSLFAASTPKPCTHFCASDEIENLISSLRLTQVMKSQ